MLKLKENGPENQRAGFRKAGTSPTNRHMVLSRLLCTVNSLDVRSALSQSFNCIWDIHERKIQDCLYKKVGGQFRNWVKHIYRGTLHMQLSEVDKAKSGPSKKLYPWKKSSILDFKDGQDYVLRVPNTHLHISVGSHSVKMSADLPLRDENYRPDIGDYVIISLRGITGQVMWPEWERQVPWTPAWRRLDLACTGRLYFLQWEGRHTGDWNTRKA